MIKGITVCNPVDIDLDYLLYTVDYAIEKGFDHMQIVGPIHNIVKGNIDGMVEYRKYAQFNNTKDLEYAKKATEAMNIACKKTAEVGIKTYFWHHELDVPNGFDEAYPEVLNENGDVEVSHPIIKDFLENKIIDFFHACPYVDGLILTLHETKVPLLKLKNQKLSKIERVKYVTKILYDTCVSLGKELIVRPFASIAEDYDMMMEAYEDISHDLMVMDKWTQFDWSLTMPHNAFYEKIKNNPLLIETDIFGEFFGKGRFPMLLKNHIKEKFEYCQKFNPVGYASRIDRGGLDPFGDVNEVNNDIINAYMNGRDVDEEILTFFEKKYPGLGREVMEIMEPTEEILKKIIYLKGYYFTELSYFPGIVHSKNHFYFEMMRDNFCIASNEWFIPKNWERGTIESVIAEKQEAVTASEELYEKLLKLEDRMDKEEYHKLWVKFYNLKLSAAIWKELVNVYINYVRFFDTKEQKYADALEETFKKLDNYSIEGNEMLKDKFLCANFEDFFSKKVDHSERSDYITFFIADVRESFEKELKAVTELEKEDLLDFVVCGGGCEGHKLMKEVNFSDGVVRDGRLCRLTANRNSEWSTIKGHGWFSYEIKVKPNAENKIKVVMGALKDQVVGEVTINDQKYKVSETVDGVKEFEFDYTETAGNDTARIRFDRISANIPYVCTIKVLK